jgi:hypothetical protein
LQILQKPAAYYSRKFLVTKHAKGRQPVCKNAVENRKQRYTKNLAYDSWFEGNIGGLPANRRYAAAATVGTCRMKEQSNKLYRLM